MLTKYLLNIKIYLFGIKKTLIWFNNYFFLLSKYLFIVSKCLVGSIEINIYLNLGFLEIRIFFLNIDVPIRMKWQKILNIKLVIIRL